MVVRIPSGENSGSAETAEPADTESAVVVGLRSVFDRWRKSCGGAGTAFSSAAAVASAILAIPFAGGGNFAHTLFGAAAFGTNRTGHSHLPTVMILLGAIFGTANG